MNDANEILEQVDLLNQNIENNMCKSIFSVVNDSISSLKTLLPSVNENLDFILHQLNGLDFSIYLTREQTFLRKHSSHQLQTNKEALGKHFF